MAGKKQIEDAIFAKEGFYVRLHLFEEKTKTLPEYDWQFMASNKWKISDWKNERLQAYRTLVKSVDVYRGDDTIVKSDLKLGSLRDSYFDARYGVPEPDAKPKRKPASDAVVDLGSRRAKRR